MTYFLERTAAFLGMTGVEYVYGCGALRIWLT